MAATICSSCRLLAAATGMVVPKWLPAGANRPGVATRSACMVIVAAALGAVKHARATCGKHGA